MQENSSQNTGTKQTFSQWFENFWYHYKWHSLIALFLAFTITVCSLQMCQKESYDIHVMYAGGYEIERKSDTGATPAYQTMLSSIVRAAADYDENGSVTVNLRDLFVLTNEEIEKIESEKGIEVNYPLVKENLDVFLQNLSVSDYYVCFLSKAMYDQYSKIDGVDIFHDLTPYVNADTHLEYYTNSAIYLSSTGFATMPGIKDMPEDTVICLRKITLVASHFNKDKAEEQFACAEKLLKSILNFTPVG